MAGYLTIITSALIAGNLYVLSKPDPAIILRLPYLSLGQITAILGTILLSITFILSSRLGFVDRLFGGFDKTYKAHRYISQIAFILILYHPIFLIVNALPNRALVLSYVVPGTNVPYFFGILALWSLILLVSSTIFIDLPYHIWKRIHEYAGIIILLAGIHTYLIPSDVSRSMALRVYMLAWIVTGAATYIWRRFLYPVFGPRYAYTVSEAARRGDTMILTLSPVSKSMPFSPGQFAFLTFPSVSGEEHPFSMAGSADDPCLKFSAKILGDDTLKLTGLKHGDNVVVRGPYGSFGQNARSDKRQLFIAGGIGITPFLSILSSHDTCIPAHVIYSASTEEDACHAEDLEVLAAARPGIQVHRHISGIHGRLTAKTIADMIPDIRNTRIYLCGPPPMMTSLRTQFVTLGIPSRRIVSEDFSMK